MDFSRLDIASHSTDLDGLSPCLENRSSLPVSQVSTLRFLQAREIGSYNPLLFSEIRYKNLLRSYAEREAPYSSESKLDAIANCVTLIARSERGGIHTQQLLNAAGSLGCSKERIVEKVKRFLKRGKDDANNSIIVDLPERVVGLLVFCSALGFDQDMMDYSTTLYAMMLRAMIWNESDLFEFMVQWAKPLKLEKALLDLPQFHSQLNPRNPLAELLNHCNFSKQAPKLAIPLIHEYQKQGLRHLVLNNIKSLREPHTVLEWSCKDGHSGIVEAIFNCFELDNREDIQKAADLLLAKNRGNTAYSLAEQTVQEQLVKWKERFEAAATQLQVPHLQKLTLQ